MILPPVFDQADHRTRRRQQRFAHRPFFHSLRPVISHSRTEVSPPPPPVASVRPSGENVSDSTRPVWPVTVRSSRPVPASHSLIDLSLHPLATVLPSGENVTESTSPTWPRRMCRTFLVSTSQSRTVPS